MLKSLARRLRLLNDMNLFDFGEGGIGYSPIRFESHGKGYSHVRRISISKQQSLNKKPMKKYIWAKDTPFNKKGSEIEIESSKVETYVFCSASMGHLIAEGWVEEVYAHWKPDVGDEYWYVSMLSETDSYHWYNDAHDNTLYSCGNVFKTKEEAIAAAEKVKALLLSLHE